MRCALAETSSREQSTPRAVERRRSPEQHRRGRSTTPLPITGVQPGVRMPEGSRCSAYFSPSDDDRVPGVVAAVELDHVVDAGAQRVGGLALALVAPLGADQHDRGHAAASYAWRASGRWAALPSALRQQRPGRRDGAASRGGQRRRRARCPEQPGLLDPRPRAPGVAADADRPVARARTARGRVCRGEASDQRCTRTHSGSGIAPARRARRAARRSTGSTPDATSSSRDLGERRPSCARRAPARRRRGGGRRPRPRRSTGGVVDEDAVELRPPAAAARRPRRTAPASTAGRRRRGRSARSRGSSSAACGSGIARTTPRDRLAVDRRPAVAAGAHLADLVPQRDVEPVGEVLDQAAQPVRRRPARAGWCVVPMRPSGVGQEERVGPRPGQARPLPARVTTAAKPRVLHGEVRGADVDRVRPAAEVLGAHRHPPAERGGCARATRTGTPGVVQPARAGDAGDPGADDDDVASRSLRARRRGVRPRPGRRRAGRAAASGSQSARNWRQRSRSTSSPIAAAAPAERGERAQEAAVRLVRPRHRALAAPAGAAQRVEPAVVADPGVRVALDRPPGRQRLARPAPPRAGSTSGARRRPRPAAVPAASASRRRVVGQERGRQVAEQVARRHGLSLPRPRSARGPPRAALSRAGRAHGQSRRLGGLLDRGAGRAQGLAGLDDPGGQAGLGALPQARGS